MRRRFGRATLPVIPLLALAFAACGGESRAPAPPGAPPAPPAARPAAAPDPGAAPGTPAAPGAPAGGASGRAVYQRTCQTCHHVNGQGMPGTFPPLAGSEIANGAKPKLIRIALHGLQGPVVVKGQRYTGVMPPWRSLSDEEMAALLTYVRSSFGNAAGAVTAADVATERAATANRTTPWTIAELER